MPKKPNLISGITISGKLTIAHYLVVIKQLFKLQSHYNLLLFVADLHATTVPYQPSTLTTNRWAALATYYAIGFRPETIFVQSDILEHTVLYFLLANFTAIGTLKRMTQFKAKQHQTEQNAGLFNYPILMAADILLYDANVIVGPDQKQHVELTRNLAVRLNNHFMTKVFHPPEIVNFQPTYRIRDLQQPTQKMSKSTANSKGTLFLSDDANTLNQKITSAVTDSENQIRFDFERKPGVSNLILLFALCCDLTIDQAMSQLASLSDYYQLKQTVAKAVIPVITALQFKQQAYLNDLVKLKKYRTIGATTARGIAATKLRALGNNFGFDW